MGRDELAEELWPDEYLDVTRVRLRQELRRLRESLGAFGHIIDADRQWVSLVAKDIAVDVWEFDAAMRNASIAEDSERRIQQYDLATKQVTGPFLAGYLEPWTLSVRQSYAERVRQAWLALAEAQEAGSLLDEAIESSL
jgi:DNA-binding SARP family transcriptional activator